MRLDGAHELLGAARRTQQLGRVDRVAHRVVGVLLPVEVVQDAHDLPEVRVLGVHLLGKDAHHAADGLTVLDVELLVVVLRQKRERRVAGDSGDKRRSGLRRSRRDLLAVLCDGVHRGSGVVRHHARNLLLDVRARDGLGLHGREEQDVADGGLVAEEHDHAVDAVADAARRRHAVLEGAHVVVVVAHGLVVAHALGGNLLGKAAGLINGVIELGEGVGVLVAGNDQLKAVGEARVLGLALGERGDLLRVVAHEGGVDDGLLAQLVVELKEELAGTPVGLDLDAVLLAELAQVLDGGVHRELLAHALGGDLGERAARPGAGHVDLLALEGDDLVALLAAADLARDGLEQALGEALHALEVGVGAVGLHRGELGVVREVHALVAELAADLKDALHAANDETLERELGGDAQVEVAVERVEVRHERTSVGAAEDGVHHRRLDLHVALGLHVAADEGDDLAALAEDVANLGVHDEVHVALTVADLAVGEAVKLLGEGPQGLGEHRELRGRDGELAATRAHDGARGAQDVAEVEVGEKRPALVTQDVVAAEELDGAGDVLEHDEGCLALLAQRPDAAGHAHHVLGVRAVREVGVLLLELAGVGRDL